MVSHYLNNFPAGYTPNDQQVVILKGIENAFAKGKKFVIVNAPTGSGKSFIAKTLGNVSRECSSEYAEAVLSYDAFRRGNDAVTVCEAEEPFGCTALTITKSLQDQYCDQFEDAIQLKGKSNYQCEVDNNYSVDVAPCVTTTALKEDCWRCDCCTYYKQRNNSVISKFNTLNYSMFFNLPEHVKRREFIVCDEASELEDQLVQMFSCLIDLNKINKAGIELSAIHTEKTNVYKWLGRATTILHERVDSLRDSLRDVKNKSKAEQQSVQKELSWVMDLREKLNLIYQTWYESEYIVERKEDNVIYFTPLKVNKLSHHLFRYSDKIVLMSATIIDVKNFCKSLGIDDYEYIETDSAFDPERAPIFCNAKVKLNYNNMNQQLPNIAKQIEQICEYHKGEKGLIHTQNFNITKYLMSKLKSDRFLFRESGVSNEALIEEHIRRGDDPTVLVSPSMTYGVDLKDDLARFQIIVKAPYLPVNDSRISKLMKSDFKWYQNKMLCTLVQACGRGVRSKDDHCNTYILDGAIVESVLKNTSKLPDYFLKRFK